MEAQNKLGVDKHFKIWISCYQNQFFLHLKRLEILHCLKHIPNVFQYLLIARDNILSTLLFQSGEFSYLWLYIVGEFLGATIGAFFYKLVNFLANVKNETEKKRKLHKKLPKKLCFLETPQKNTFSVKK